MVKKVIMNLDFSKASGPDCQGLGHYNYFVHFSLLYSYYVSDMIKKLELIFTGS